MSYSFNFGVIWANFDNLLSGWPSVLRSPSLRIADRHRHRAHLRLRRAGEVAGCRARWWRPMSPSSATSPLLVIVLFVYFALPRLGIRLGKIESFVVSLALYAGAYLTEVFRASLAGVPAGRDRRRPRHRPRPGSGGASMSILPIMLRNALPALGTTFISLFKDTSHRRHHCRARNSPSRRARSMSRPSASPKPGWRRSVLYVSTCLAARRRACARLERRFPKF